MTDQRTFPNEASSVTASRRYVLRALGDAAESVADAIALMVSELSANAVRHTATDFTVTLDRTDTGVRISVSDSGPGRPVVRTPDPTEPSGRGLQIVAALADEWGIVPSPSGPGKTVWFTLELSADSEAEARRGGERVEQLESTGSASSGTNPMSAAGDAPRGERRPSAHASASVSRRATCRRARPGRTRDRLGGQRAG